MIGWALMQSEFLKMKRLAFRSLRWHLLTYRTVESLRVSIGYALSATLPNKAKVMTTVVNLQNERFCS